MSTLSLAQSVRDLLDREEIRELTARYAHGVALGDGTAVASLFTDDAVFSTEGGDEMQLPNVLRGRDAITKFYAGLRPGAALPCVHNHVIQLDGERATGSCTLEVRIALGGHSLSGAGYYEDAYRREGGR
ncbi:MAG TPA: nuclear transport factor 2 family protein, partial [Myxococcota bacterium]|nr:nuclear transport factor 2 family protein [Myxococcota bacterium]